MDPLLSLICVLLRTTFDVWPKVCAALYPLRSPQPKIRLAVLSGKTLTANSMEQDRLPLLRPSEFACLQHQHTRLYTEIIQVIEPKQRYWARPVLLCESVELSSEGTGVMETVYDVRSCADLLWPRSLFQTVFDTELIPLLVHLHANPHPSDSVVSAWTQPLALARQKLHQFMQTIWHANPTAF